ncbi:MAG: 6-carboxytetrahydropterin synthase [Pseudomonadota bacterium]
MYALEVRDHIMIAHSLPSPVFGPAQGMHGATFTVDVAFFSPDLDAHGLVVDIGLASDALDEVLAPLRYKNLDEVPDFKKTFTTTEFLCGHIFSQMAERLKSGILKDEGRVRRMRVMLHESHIARAWYEADV